MTSTDAVGYTVKPAKEATDPPRPRRAPPVFIHDILTTERGVPTMLAHWFAARDMQRWEDD